MRRSYVIGGIVTAAVLAAGGVGLDLALTGTSGPAYGAAPTGTPTSSPAATGVGTASLAPGTALVDGSGRTLYLFEADSGSTSNCNGTCAHVWPPVLDTGTLPAVTGAARTALLGTTTRADGTRQVTYNGHPLYFFAGDKARGDAKGQGITNFGGAWYVVDPAGNKIDPDEAAAPAATGY